MARLGFDRDHVDYTHGALITRPRCRRKKCSVYEKLAKLDLLATSKYNSMSNTLYFKYNSVAFEI